MKRVALVAARVALVAALAACHVHGTPKNAKAPEAGVSIAIYERDGAGYSVVDDRRFITVGKDTSILLSNIDPGADLASLVLEPTNPALHVGSCTRERLPEGLSNAAKALEDYAEREKQYEEQLRRRARGPHVPLPPPPQPPTPSEDSSVHYAPVVRCEITAAPGNYLLRMLYVSTTLRYHAQHDIGMTTGATKANVISRFAVETPNWGTRADVTLFDGVPGGEKPPQEVTHGSISLDGTVAILAVPAKDVDASVRRIYDGAILTTSEDHTDPLWGRDSQNSVWVWLELAGLRLAPGPIHVHLDDGTDDARDLDIASENRKQGDEPNAPLRLPLWVDEDLRGMRTRTIEYNDGNALSERLVFGIGNTGDTDREVFVDEHLRPAQKRKVEHPFPKKPAAAPDDVLRIKIDAKPGRVTRAGYTLSYEFTGR